MRKSIKNEDKILIFKVRKNYIDKICSWQIKIFYGILLFVGSITIMLISKDKLNYAIYVIVTILPILAWLEYSSLRSIENLHFNLVKDVKNNNVSNFKKQSMWDVFFR